ncbi:uncharacterized protein LOC141851552 [Brevipalpus obovatus]|uniref:uncharacterized protein LOC141851552 n=1 Tax=Brevipalpus obovatus TaxID=246614 RepID=UPI003D9F7A24
MRFSEIEPGLIAGHIFFVPITTQAQIRLVVESGKVLVYYLCDANYKLDNARIPLSLVYFLWIAGAVCCGIYYKLAHRQPSRYCKSWVQLCQVFEDYSFHHTGPHFVLNKFFVLIVYTFLGTAALVGVGLDISWFFWTPREYWFFGIFFTLYHVLTTFLTISYATNSTVFYTLHNLLYSKCFLALHSDLLRIKRKTNEVQKIKEQSIFFKRYTSLYRKAFNTYNFYRIPNSFLFIVTYFNHSMIIYYVFFSKILYIYRIFLLAYCGLNFFSGLSMHFLVSDMVTEKIRAINHGLISCVYNVRNGRVKRKILILLENTECSNLFSILGGLYYKKSTMILVLLESTMLVLMIIANSNHFESS